jgi:hypothetical protein
MPWNATASGEIFVIDGDTARDDRRAGRRWPPDDLLCQCEIKGKLAALAAGRVFPEARIVGHTWQPTLKQHFVLS